MCHPMSRILLVLSLLAYASIAPAKTFKIATIAPENTQWTITMKAAAKQIRAETEGRVKIKFYGGGVMGNDNQVLSKIRIGQLQGAALTSGPLVRFYPDLELYTLPMVFHTYDEVDHIRGIFDQRLRDGLAGVGYVSFGFAEGGFAYTLSKQKIASIEDARRQKVWIPSDDLSALEAFRVFGITPVPLGLADVLLSLQTNTVNAVTGPANAVLALQWHTQVKYLIDLPLIYTFATLVIPKPRFDEISRSDQAIVQRYMSEAFKKIDQNNRNDLEAAFMALKRQGIEFVQPTPEQIAGWRVLGRQAVQRSTEKGLPSPALYQEMNQALERYRKDHAR